MAHYGRRTVYTTGSDEELRLSLNEQVGLFGTVFAGFALSDLRVFNASTIPANEASVYIVTLCVTIVLNLFAATSVTFWIFYLEVNSDKQTETKWELESSCWRANYLNLLVSNLAQRAILLSVPFYFAALLAKSGSIGLDNNFLLLFIGALSLLSLHCLRISVGLSYISLANADLTQKANSVTFASLSDRRRRDF
eukprot:gb/GEZN01010098.1/.p1 GENE.gb/GEZN01010098.1/~~gb/GEZN01010098.1/.p1  ORF type:complete len:195 (+),score=17.80 gb/GEZN01010098.1/:53-637(+)